MDRVRLAGTPTYYHVSLMRLNAIGVRPAGRADRDADRLAVTAATNRERIGASRRIRKRFRPGARRNGLTVHRFDDIPRADSRFSIHLEHHGLREKRVDRAPVLLEHAVRALICDDTVRDPRSRRANVSGLRDERTRRGH